MIALKLIALGCILGVAIAVGAWLGFEKGLHNASLEEVKVLRAVLKKAKRTGRADAVCGQFVLARYYRKLADVDASWREGLIDDLGPVDKALLSGVGIDKDPVDLDELYLQAVPTASGRKSR